MEKEQLFQALLNKDNDYVNDYYAAVQTTGVYCDMTCACRKPLLKNTIFFKDILNCISEGYRACKICKPLSAKALRTGSFKNSYFLDYILWLEACKCPPKSYRDHPIGSFETLTSIKTLFQKCYGISLGKYIRIKRSTHILNEDSVDKINTIKIFFTYIETPLGTMVACDSLDGISLLEFVDRKMLETELLLIKKKISGYFTKFETSNLLKLKTQLHEYFSKKRKCFDLKLNLIGTDFQKKVWDSLLNVPYGQTITYLEQAYTLNNPNAVRAIANANGKNTISIIIPCHRIIGSNGKMVGYGGGIHRKKSLISLENEFENP